MAKSSNDLLAFSGNEEWKGPFYTEILCPFMTKDMG